MMKTYIYRIVFVFPEVCTAKVNDRFSDTSDLGCVFYFVSSLYAPVGVLFVFLEKSRNIS